MDRVGFGLATALFFGPFIIVMVTLVFAGATLKYVFTGKLTVPSGAEGILAGWAIAAVLAFLVLPTTHFLMWLYSHAAPHISFVPERKAEFLYMSIAGGLLALVTLALCVGLFISQYVKTPEACYTQGRDELDEKGPATGSLYFSLGAMLLIMFVAAPAGTMLAAAYKRSYGVGWKPCEHLAKMEKSYEEARGKERGWDPPVCGYHHRREAGKAISTCTMGGAMVTVVRVFYCLACWPALVLGFGAIRRGLWMISIKRMVENVATSTVRGAAMGLVELHGKAQPVGGGDGDGAEILACRSEPMAGRRVKVQSFYLEDKTGRTLVDVPEDCVPGDDQRIVITRRARVEGSLQVYRLLAGDEVYVIGDLTTQKREGEQEDVIRPWSLPYGRFLLGFTNALFNRSWDLIGIVDLNSILGFGFLPHIFLVCDGDEKVAKEAMFRGWKRQVVMGACMLAAAGGLLLYTDLVLPK